MTQHTGFALRARDDSGVNFDGPHDLYLDETNNLAMVYGGDAVVQHARQRIRTHQGEWFLDSEAGVPWLEEVLGKRPDAALVDALLKAEVLDTDGVTEINSISIRFDRTTRGFTVDTLDLSTIYTGE